VDLSQQQDFGNVHGITSSTLRTNYLYFDLSRAITGLLIVIFTRSDKGFDAFGTEIVFTLAAWKGEDFVRDNQGFQTNGAISAGHFDGWMDGWMDVVVAIRYDTIRLDEQEKCRCWLSPSQD
jgi:hypothetical protein